MYCGDDIELSLRWSSTVQISMSRGKLSLGYNSQRRCRKPWHLTRRMATPCGLTPLLRIFFFVWVAFYIIEKGDTPPPGHQFIKCHIIFVVKMEDLRHKARMVSGDHMTDVPPTITYAIVASHDTVRIYLKMAALNNMRVKNSDIVNSYIKSTCI